MRGIATDLVNRAYFVHQSGQRHANILRSTVENHSAMVDVLLGLGLNAQSLKSSMTYDGGLQLTGSDVVEHFGWALNTFLKRGRLYRAAAAIAATPWREADEGKYVHLNELASVSSLYCCM